MANDSTSLVACCTRDQSHIFGQNAGRIATIHGREALITYDESVRVSSLFAAHKVHADFRNANAAIQSVSPECQAVIDKLDFHDPAIPPLP